MSTTITRRCVGWRKNGEPCRKPPRRGHDTCQAHGERPRGRPSKFTPETRAKVIQALKAGVWKKDAAGYAGISVATLEAWLARGRKTQEEAHTDDYSDFLEAVSVVQAGFKVLLVGRITAASEKDWRAAMALLERMWPNEYSQRDAKLVEHTGTFGVTELLGGRQPVAVSRQTREKIMTLLAEEDARTIEGTAEDRAG